MTARRLTLLLATAIALAPRGAAAWSLLGGRTLGVRDSAVHVQVGYPEIDVQYHIPVLKRFEVIPRFQLYYAPAFIGEALDAGSVGNLVGATLKYQLLDEDGFSLALQWEPELIFHYSGEFAFGARLGVPGGAEVAYEFKPGYTVFGGLNLPMTVIFTGNPAFFLPFEFDMGVEFPLTSQVNLSFLLELGPVIQAPKDADASVGFDFKGMFGLELLL